MTQAQRHRAVVELAVPRSQRSKARKGRLRGLPGGTVTAPRPSGRKPAPAEHRPTQTVPAESARSAVVTDLLAELSRTTDPTLRARIQSDVAIACLPVARSVARRYSGRGVDLADLEQVAALGLVKAARRWKPGLSDDFLQFAVPTITGEIKRYFRDSWWTVRPPRRLQETQLAAGRVRQDLEQELGAAPTDEQVAEALDVSPGLVREAEQARRSSRTATLDDPDAVDPEIERALVDEDAGLQNAEDRMAIESALATLTRREQTVVHLRYYRSWSQARIGKRIGVSQMQVSRILKDVLGKLRDRLGQAS